jgi:hypothetical protein
MQKPYPRFPHLTPKEAQELTESSINVDHFNCFYINLLTSSSVTFSLFALKQISFRFVTDVRHSSGVSVFNTYLERNTTAAI